MSRTALTNVCSECPARCCTATRWRFKRVVLTEREFKSKLFKDHAFKDPMTGSLVLSLVPKCRFLGKDNRCTIYHQRPKACRGYVCHYEPDIVKRLKDYPTHHRLLKRWKVLPGMEYGLTEEQIKEAEAYQK